MRVSTFFALLFSVGQASYGQDSILDFKLNYGDYVPGFNHYIITDSTRTYNRHLDYNGQCQHRKIPVSLWYPSSNLEKSKVDGTVSETRLSVRDYFKILAEEEEWENLPDEHLLNWFWYIPNNKKNQKHLSLQTNAYLDIPKAKGQFPVIVYAPSYQASSIENFAVCEYLASHGYIVISSPSRGTYNRKFEGGTSRDMETQANDISFLIAHSYTLPSADRDRIATFGFSFGGLSNVLAQMKDARIKATASLDGSIKYQFNTLKESPFYNMERATNPFLHIAQKEIPEAVLKEDKIDPKLNTEFLFWDNLKDADGYSFQMHNMAHSNFGAFSLMFENRDMRQEKSGEKILASYGLSAHILKTFFDLYLKNEKDASKLLRYANNDIVSVKTKTQPEQKLTVLNFIHEADTQEYANMDTLFSQYKKQHPDFEIPERVLNHKGLRLGFNPKTAKQGYKLFEFATRIYPQSSNLQDSWAEVYWADGDFDKAKIHFEKSLKLNPENKNAINRLRELSIRN